MKAGTLILLPNLLGEEADPSCLPANLNTIAQQLDGFFVESERGGRRACRRMLGPNFTKPYLAIGQEQLTVPRCDELLAPLLSGQRWGLLSDAGMPCLADPGHALVARAHYHQLPVTALPGPSSIFLACALSGLPCQNFTFHGYLPKEKTQRQRVVQELEKSATTHLWIETPYRTQSLLEELIALLHPKTRLALATNLTLPTEHTVSQSIAKWKQETDLSHWHDRPAIFLIHKA
jgi:16S rRNA (cytidine1402-2'-O)-methyltransferase